ncbi:ferrochelatase [Mycetocola reblochoni]|uniref:Coproporphyrin III ferrochelatase n=2 Tax=Mycetocola reblochoni TaxID=331618 RepID=A0A1R4IRJ7_9MICO|nr:ferrochelatase [Mycetocola reblochoni]RLP71135.1 ferrochelatase [Mycetocola reblochoni]SJN22521.1 Ferrochelatase, protoheme ferro-lyase [Mycetocola reblochoni REB411]
MTERVLGASPAAASGEEHVTVPVAYDAIILAGFGGPEGQEDVIPFLRNVTGGRGIPEERLEEVGEHYRHFGGVSPINEHNRQLKAALEAELASRGIDLPVIWGNRNWEPYITDAVQEAYDRGFRTLLTLATSAYSSYSSDRQYREDMATALERTGLLGEVSIDKVRQYFDHPGFITPFIEGTTAGVRELLAQNPDLDPATDIQVLYTTHSIPNADADRSGPSERCFPPGGAYVAQHLAVARTVNQAVTAELGLDAELEWSMVYQSRSGPPTQPWLEPDINDAIAELPSAGRRAVVIVPIGFVSDHMEVMWDLDNEALTTAAEHGLAGVRVPTPGVHPAFVSGLVDLVMERVNGVPLDERPAETELGPWYDICRPGCCVNGKFDPKPAIAGIAP